jgi:hypothetical protein
METMQKVLESYKPSMAEKVVRFRLEKVRNILDESNFETIVYLATRFSFEDTLILGTTYPTIYAEAFTYFIEQTFEEFWTYSNYNREGYNDELAKAISDDFHDFKDVLGQFARDNIKIIKKRGNE